MRDNLFVSALHRAAPDEIARLKPISYQHGDLLADAGAPIEHVLFPTSGLISLVVGLSEGDNIEAAMVGYEGLVGGAVAFGSKMHVNTAFAQIPGRGWIMNAPDFSDIVRREPQLEALLIAHEQYMLAQAQQTAACNARHHIPRRMATWLLRACDASGEDELTLTQEYMAQMLGVQRASVSVFAAQLQDKHLIRYRRGRVAISNRDGLAERACECHHALRSQRSRLFETGKSSRMASANNLGLFEGKGSTIQATP